MPQELVQAMWFMLYICFPLGSLGFSYVRAIHDQPPADTLGTECLTSFPGGQHPHMGQNAKLEELSVSCATPQGQDSWKFVPAFLQTPLHVPFPWADFALSPFAVLNLTCKYDFMLSPERSSCESVKLGDP